MNSEEIAKLANVSRSTVSRVINNYKNVPKETRERVQKVIDEYGYTPNVSARTLAGKANNIIGVFLADVNETSSNGKWIGAKSPYNMELLANIINSCKIRGYLTLVYTITELEEFQQMEQYFTNRMIFGGIFVGFPYRTKQLENLAQKGHNIVMIDQLSEADDKQIQYKLVNTDNVLGGYLATKYLIDRGHKKIAHISGDHRLSSIQREEGYRKALKEAGIKWKETYVVRGNYRDDIAYKVTLKLLLKEKPSALFVANDIMAIGAIRAIQEIGLKIPEDISIVGFDNLESSEWMNLQLTTVHTPLVDIAEMSVGKLFSKSKGVHEVCIPQMIERMSVTEFR